MGKPRRDGWEGEACTCGSPKPFVSDQRVAEAGKLSAAVSCDLPGWERCPTRAGYHVPEYTLTEEGS